MASGPAPATSPLPPGRWRHLLAAAAAALAAAGGIPALAAAGGIPALAAAGGVPALAAPSHGTITVAGALHASWPIAGSCQAHTDAVSTTVSLHTEPVNGATLAITGTGPVPGSPVDLASSASFNAELEVVSGAGAGGSWLAGIAGASDLGSGTLSLSPSASSGSLSATLEPYGGGSIDAPVTVRASWSCASATPATPAAGGGTSPSPSKEATAVLESRVPKSFFGCTADPRRDLGGAGTMYSYDATAEVDCEVEGVLGVSLAIYTLYPSTKAMDAAFSHLWIDEVARPRRGLGCPSASFDTGACDYRVGSSKATAGRFVRFFFGLPGDPITTPAIAWTSNRYDVIVYVDGAESNGTTAVLRYWESGRPNPV